MNPEIKAVRSKMPCHSRDRSNSKAIVLLLMSITAWAATALMIFYLPLPLSWIGILAHGIAIAMLFVVGHDAAHGNLVTSHPVNRVIATLAFLPSLHPYSSWARSHNIKHHGWTNLKGEDPAYAPYSLEEYQQLSPGKRLLVRFHRTWLGLGVLYFNELYCKHMMFPKQSHLPADRRAFRWEQLAVGTFLAIQLAAAYGLSILTDRPFPVLFTVYAGLCPFFVFLWLIGFITFQHHTNPEIPWFDQKHEWSFFQCQVAGTTHVQFPRIFDVVFLNILEHSAHHVDPLVPLYHLQTSQKALEAAFPGTIKIIGWNPNVLWTSLSRCKLYDYRAHRWLDFNGNPTTPRIMVNQIPPEAANVEAPRVHQPISRLHEAKT